MIWESASWKDDLLKQAKDLRRRIQQRRWPEASLARLEQTIMLGFYSIRKLAEAKKLSDSIVARRVTLAVYPAKGKPVTRLNWHNLDSLYDFNERSEKQLSLLEVCDQFIHSYVFSPVFIEEGKLHGILFCSDRIRRTELYEITIEQTIKLFELVGTDYPAEGSMKFNPTKGDFDVTNDSPS